MHIAGTSHTFCSADAVRAVKPLLSALALSSKGGAACAAKACSLLAQKNTLHSKQVGPGG
eukprot:1157902-Pelagomonas_calceolata.AAC.11